MQAEGRWKIDFLFREKVDGCNVYLLILCIHDPPLLHTLHTKCWLYFLVFGSLNMSRSNSMMSSGQCRLAPLIPCIQDSSQLYDYCVKILFKLHASKSCLNRVWKSLLICYIYIQCHVAHRQKEIL